MRGSALRAPAGKGPPVPTRGLAGDVIPVHPDQEGPCPSVERSRQRRPAPTPPAKGCAPYGTRAQGALLPKTPAPGLGRIPNRRRRTSRVAGDERLGKRGA